MVRPSQRTRSVKKVKKRTPGGRTVTHYRSGKTKSGKCGRCSAQLKGVASGTEAVRKTPKGSRTPTRPYSGELCGGCLDKLVRYTTRMQAKHAEEGYKDLEVARDLTLEKFLPRGWFKKIEAGEKWSMAVKAKKIKKTPAKAKSAKKEKPVKKKPAKKASAKKPKAKAKAKAKSKKK
ncbi:hypothetical protein ACFLRF_00990 [Candidatus Altiarchaeota archaeon]